MNNTYKKQVALLIKIAPLLYPIKEFAIHGGTAINLFHRNLPRYSVDLDITYIPIKSRDESLEHINLLLAGLKVRIEKSIPNIKVVHKPNVWKLQCSIGGATVKLEVNGIKRGIIGEIEEKELCQKAQDEFNTNCIVRIVPFSLLYGGKIAAALSRQHPRDLFDYSRMDNTLFSDIKDGFLFYLLGADKPIIELLNPNLIDQRQALENQFRGMTDEEFEYADYEKSRLELISKIANFITDNDKEFFVSFEKGEPNWELCSIGDISHYPSIAWKLQNINNLRVNNPTKHNEGVQRLTKYLYKTV